MIKKILLKLLEAKGYQLVKEQPPVDMENEFHEIYEKCKPFTMTSVERMYALFKATKYIVESGIQGDFVECGVWRGGSSMNIALTLKHSGDVGRSIFLYDTYTGMSQPSAHDAGEDGIAASVKWQKLQNKNFNEWCYAPLDDVRENVLSTGYPVNNLTFVKGKVEESIPQVMPEQIALLRLDTDWYESTLHELEYLFPRLVHGGVLLIDDYGHWQGARKAVDEYIEKNNVKILLNRVDYTGRIAIKITPDSLG